MNGTKSAALVAVPAALLAAGAFLLLLPWDPRSNVPVEPGSDTLTSGHTWWGLTLFVLALTVLALATGRYTARPGTTMAAVGGTPAALLLVSHLTHEPDPDGFAGLWPAGWLVAAALMLLGTGLVAALARPDRTPDVLTADLRDRLLPVAAAAAAGFTGFLTAAVASDAGPFAHTFAALLSLALGHGLGWALRAGGRGPAASAVLTAAGVAVTAALDHAGKVLWSWPAPDPLAWATTLAAYPLGALLAHATGRGRPGRRGRARPAR
ncbi:hypothetical protein [Streptomyces sp. NPDC012888]|uniref:hypothetical protein n=1 Tax=Streptomyces sp. NPDC012888 TaxID=3364855 RepID=UPI00368297DC